jgi:osmotically-inducible protein OsmY
MSKWMSAALAFVCIAGACKRGPDPGDQAEKALRDANLTSVTFKWDDDARIGHLQGTVDTPTDRQRAEDVAQAAVGTTGRVLNELTVKGLNEDTADDLDGTIRSTLKKMVDNNATLEDRDIDFEVTNGVVTVKGAVRSAAEKAKVTEIVRAAPGVKDMANALEIKPEK